MIYIDKGINTFQLYIDTEENTNNQYIMRLKNHLTHDIKDVRLKNSSQYAVDNLTIGDEILVATGNTFVTGNTQSGYTHIDELNIDVLNYNSYIYSNQYKIFTYCTVENNSYVTVYDYFNSAITNSVLLNEHYCYNFNIGKFINDYFIVTFFDGLAYKYKAIKFRLINDEFGIKYATVWNFVFDVDYDFSDFHKIENSEIVRLYYENDEYNSVYKDFVLSFDSYGDVNVSEFTIDYVDAIDENVEQSKVWLKEFEGHNDFFLYENPQDMEIGELVYRGLVFVNKPLIIYTTNTKDLKFKVKNYE